MENVDVAEILSEVADLLELSAGNAFKVRAYRRAAQLVELLPRPLADLQGEGKLVDLPGIGANIANHIGEILQTGTFGEREVLRRNFPPGVLELLRVEGMGPKTVSLVWKQLGITDVGGLEQCCQDGRLAHLPRMGAKRVAGILAAIARYRARLGRVPIHRAVAEANALLAVIRRVPGVVRAEAAGSVRRRKETVGDLDLLVATGDPAPVWRALSSAGEVLTLAASGPTKAVLRLRSGLSTDVRAVPPESFGAAWHYFTGSKSHNIAIRLRAMKRGLKLSEYGVFDRKERRVAGATEEEVFRAVDLPWIPPELREDSGEIAAAELGELPELVTEEELLGDLHVHSKVSSDGTSTVEELLAEGLRLGRRYLSIADHSRSRPLGLTAEGLLAHAARIRTLARKHRKLHLLAGVEVDVLLGGALDLPEEVLATLDCVVASVHSHFDDPREVMTERLVRAVRSGVVHVLGHPTGRQLGARDPYDFDFDRVVGAAREAGVALEVNAMPERLDLCAEHCREVKQLGAKVVISTDAHHVSQLGNLKFGVWMARRGWLEASDVLTTETYEHLRQTWLKPRSGRGRRAAGEAPHAPGHG